MGMFFTIGEKKKRAGVYQRYENVGGVQVAGATDGIVACCIRSNWGEMGKVVTLESAEAVKEAFGNGGDNDTVSLLTQVFNGGAIKVYCVRIGNGGTKATAVLRDTESSPAEAVNVRAKYVGNRKLTYTIRTVLGEADTKEWIVYEGVRELEKITFSSGDDEIDSFLEKTKKSNYFTFEKAENYSGTNHLASITQAECISGTNPTVTNEDYSDAFVLLEPYYFNTICVDTDNVLVHTLLSAYVNRVYREGKMCFGVIGEPTSVAFETRLSHAKAFNDYNIVYVGGGTIQSTGEVLEGYKMAAYIAGKIAATPSNQSLTHKTIANAVDVIEKLTNSQYEQTIDSGLFTFSVSNSGSVWIESGITTLNNLEAEDDEGWKKIKRAKIRFELMTRANDTVEPLIGNVNNNSDGRSTVMQAVQGLLNAMVTEEKLLSGAAIELDPNNAPQGDSAWFHISADDVDSLEKMYFVFKFRFSPAV